MAQVGRYLGLRGSCPYVAVIVFESAEEWKEILQTYPTQNTEILNTRQTSLPAVFVPREDLNHEIENALDVLKRNNLMEF